MASKRKASNENNQQGTVTRKLNSVQRTLSVSKRELGNREYGEGYEVSREDLRSDKGTEEAEGAREGLSDPVEGSLKQVPENPPMPLYEANQIITAAERYWGLNSGEIRGSKRKFHIVWARYVVCSILNRKGYTVGAIDTVLNKKKGAAHHGLKAFDSITKTYPKYRDQVVQFDRYLWNKQTANSREGYNSVAANR